MIEAGVSERVQQLVGDADSRGNEIGVEAGRTGAGSDLHEVASRGRLAAGQVHLQHAERRRLVHHADPGRRVELALARVERERVGAIGASERTAMRQLGEQAERRMQGS
jgi:hypothetical protein